MSPVNSGSLQTYDIMKKFIAGILLCLSLNAAAQDVGIDFSRVGYMWGEKPIPQYENMIVLTPPADGADATAMIQEALDNVKTPGAVLLRKGLYNVAGSWISPGMESCSGVKAMPRY